MRQSFIGFAGCGSRACKQEGLTGPGKSAIQCRGRARLVRHANALTTNS